MSLLAWKINIIFSAPVRGAISKNQNYENNYIESKPTQSVLAQGKRFVKDGCNLLFDYMDVQGALLGQCDHRV